MANWKKLVLAPFSAQHAGFSKHSIPIRPLHIPVKRCPASPRPPISRLRAVKTPIG